MWVTEVVAASLVPFDSSAGFFSIIRYIPTKIGNYPANNQEHWKSPKRPLLFHCIAHNHDFHDLHDILPHAQTQGGKLDNKPKEMAKAKIITYLGSHDSHRLMDKWLQTISLFLVFQTDFVQTFES